jgi:trimeric autotransporter adhesin
MSSTKQKLRLAGAFAALATLALAISCTGFFVNPTLTSLAIGPQNISLAPLATQQMVATGTYSDGSTQTVTGQVSWSSTDQSVANFSPTVLGELIAGPLSSIPNPPGTTTIAASDGTVAASAITVTVCPIVETLVVTVGGGTSQTIDSGDIASFVATATFSGVTGSQSVTDTVTWNISDTSILPSITDGQGTTVDEVDGTTSVSATLCGFTSQNVTLTTQD